MTVRVQAQAQHRLRICHILSQCSVDTTLCGHRVRSCGEELGYTGSVEAGLCQTERGSKTSSTGTDNNGIVFMVYDGVLVADMV